MLEVFVRKFDEVKKASIDAKIHFDISGNEKKTLENLKKCLHEATVAIKTLSMNKANLNTCDLTMSKLVRNLRSLNNRICSKFAEFVWKCYKERRNDRFCNELAFLLSYKVPQDDNMFYGENSINFEYFEEDLEYFVPDCRDSVHQEAPECEDALVESMNIDLDEPISKRTMAIASFADLMRDLKRNKILTFSFKNMAKALLAIRPTSTEVERSFSTCSLTMAPRRSNMKVELLEAILITNKFYST